MRQKKKIRKKKLAYGNIASSAKCVICRNVVYTFDGLNNGAKVKKRESIQKNEQQPNFGKGNGRF